MRISYVFELFNPEIAQQHNLLLYSSSSSSTTS